MNRPFRLALPVVLAALLSSTTGETQAGPNTDGVLVPHIVPFFGAAAVFTAEPEPCSGSLDTCEDADVRYDFTDTITFEIYAAFRPEASPRLQGVTFGIDYNDAEVFLAAWETCGDFELATSDWPDAGSGTALTFTTPQEASINRIYWFAAYNYYGNPNTFDLIPHPTQGANFADDSVPSELDPITALGYLGFMTDGSAPCPQEGPPGACCFDDGSCTVTLVEDCELAGGSFQGEGTDCDTADCEPVLGACCLDGGQNCEITTEADCTGDWLGPDTSCDECIVPVHESTWGGVKRVFR